MDRKTVLERAFELAASGKCVTVGEIKDALSAEGYVTAQVEGRELHRQLRARIEKTRQVEG